MYKITCFVIRYVCKNEKLMIFLLLLMNEGYREKKLVFIVLNKIIYT